MNALNKLLIPALLISVLIGTGHAAPDEAWWLRATFTPTQVSYDDMPVSQIHSGWVKISMLSYESLPAEAKADFTWMHKDGFVFQVDDFFHLKDRLDRVLCGVYQDDQSKQGRFVLVLERPRNRQSEKWKVAFLHSEVGEPGFSVLRSLNGALYWGTCMQCGEFSRFRRKGNGFVLEVAP